MGRQIIKKPNGKFAIWSSIVDDFIYDDIYIKDYIQIRRDEAANQAEDDIWEIVKQLDKGKPYAQFQMTYEEAVETRNRVHNRDK